MNRLFITGTDTEVGKTRVTACLASAWRARGHAPRAVKPLATGSPPPGEDAEFIARAAGHAPAGFACLPEPASPERAARQARISIDDESLVAWVRAQTGDPVLVEGVGGWSVPITQAMTIEDLAMELGDPVLIVAANRLGMINHTLLTVDAVRQCGLPIAGIVINHLTANRTTLHEWNIEDIRRWVGPGTPIATLNHMTSNDDLAVEGEALLSALGF
jgi:dethiobiotin synthase